MDQKKLLLHMKLVSVFFLLALLVATGISVLKEGSLTSVKDGASIQELAQQENIKEMPMEKEEILEGRMDIEIHDYSGWASNPRHVPKNPGNP